MRSKDGRCQKGRLGGLNSLLPFLIPRSHKRSTAIELTYVAGTKSPPHSTGPEVGRAERTYCIRESNGFGIREARPFLGGCICITFGECRIAIKRAEDGKLLLLLSFLSQWTGLVAFQGSVRNQLFQFRLLMALGRFVGFYWFFIFLSSQLILPCAPADRFPRLSNQSC